MIFTIFNGRTFHEAIKGVVNKRLFNGRTDSKFKNAIKEFVMDIKELARQYIWLPRCEEMNKWELNQGITKHMKWKNKIIF